MADYVLLLSTGLLVLAIFLFIVLIILTKSLRQLKRVITTLQRKPRVACSYTNTANEIELNQQQHSTTHQEHSTPSVRPARPISGTCPWIRGSRESIVLVPSRKESLNETDFHDNGNMADMKTVSFGTFQ